MVSMAPAVPLGAAALVAVALALLLHGTEGAVAGDELGPTADECLPGGTLGDAHPEEEVERAEEALAASMRTELLQRRRDLLHVGGSVGAANVEAEQRRLQRRVEQQAEVIAQLRRALKSEDDTIEELLRERDNRSGEVAPAASLALAEAPEVSGSRAAVDCEAYPMFCHPKVNCAADPLSDLDIMALDRRIATEDGHSNPRSWCLAYPAYATPLQKCVLEGDLHGYAQEMLASQAKANLLDVDALYCFMSGHCNDTDVTLNTTVLESEAICDRRYGHARWAEIGWRDFRGVLKRSDQVDEASTEGLPPKSWERLLALARHEAEISVATSCAMGNFHCDVAYCRASYCGNAHYHERFGNLTWAVA